MNTASPHVKIKKTILTQGVSTLQEELMFPYLKVPKCGSVVKYRKQRIRKGLDLIGKEYNSIRVVCQVDIVHRPRETKNTSFMWLCGCLLCGDMFLQRTASITREKSSCCGCTGIGRPGINSDNVRDELRAVWGDRFTLLNEYTVWDSPLELHCRVCDTTFKAKAWPVIKGKALGCKCRRNYRRTKEEALELIAANGYILVSELGEDYSTSEKVVVQCRDCSDVYDVVLSTLIHKSHKHTCKLMSEPTYVYILICDRTGLYKIGISNNPEQRIRSINLEANDEYNFTSVFSRKLSDRNYALVVEKFLHQLFKNLTSNTLKEFTGHKEIFCLGNRELSFLKSFLGDLIYDRLP